jgi:hypothetical protein
VEDGHGGASLCAEIPSVNLWEIEMTRRVLSWWILAVLAYLVALVVITAYVGAECGPDSKAFKTITSLTPVLLALPAAWLAACFQKRSSFLSNVRVLYERSVLAVQSAIQYTHLEKPQARHFAAVQKELSSVIDLFRGSFSNVGEDKGKIGLFPFEALKTMQDWVSSLRSSDHLETDEKIRRNARRSIVELWQKRLRPSLLAELDRQRPTKFDSPYWIRADSAEAWPRPSNAKGPASPVT